MALTNCCSLPRLVKVKPIKGKVDIYCTKKKMYLVFASSTIFLYCFVLRTGFCSFFPFAGCQGDVLKKMTMTVFPMNFTSLGTTVLHSLGSTFMNHIAKHITHYILNESELK